MSKEDRSQPSKLGYTADERRRVSAEIREHKQRRDAHPGVTVRYRPEDGSYVVFHPLDDSKPSGLAARVVVQIVEGDPVIVFPIEWVGDGPWLPARDERTTRLLRAMGLPDVLGALEHAVRFDLDYSTEDEMSVAEHDSGVAWLRALSAHRKRAGALGTHDALYVETAQHRVEADREAPRGAVRYMMRRWPEKYPNESTTTSAVNKAIKRGLLHRVDRLWELTPYAERLLNRGQ